MASGISEVVGETMVFMYHCMNFLGEHACCNGSSELVSSRQDWETPATGDRWPWSCKDNIQRYGLLREDRQW